MPTMQGAPQFNVEQLSRRIKTLSDGTSACREGFHGSLRPASMRKVLSAGFGVANKVFVDFGSGDGFAVFAAVLLGASRGIGFELPANVGLRHICDSVEATLVQDGLIRSNVASFVWSDVEALNRLDGGPHFVFAFWTGMHADTRAAIIALVRGCTSCETLAVTNAKDETVERLLVELNHKVSKAGRRWSYCGSFRVSMIGSGERKTVWIFIRPPSREDGGSAPGDLAEFETQTGCKPMREDHS